MIKAVMAVMMLAAVGCSRVESSTSWPAGQPPADPPGADCRELTKSNNDFALRLYAALAERDGDIFFSPSSLHTVLTMTYAGARGKTAEQMAATLALPGGEWSNDRIAQAYREVLLRLKPDAKARYNLSVADAIWGQKETSWVPGFLALAKDNYGAGLRQVDFKGDCALACQEINRWVEQQTNEKIKDLVSPGVLGARTRLVLTNAIYFYSEWVSRFKTQDTKDEPFFVTPDQPVQVPMMHQEGPFPLGGDEQFQVLIMPYAGKELSMVILLPRKPDGLGQLEKNLPEAIRKADAANLQSQGVAVWLPRFKMTSEFSLASTLASMGMTDAFTERADFTGMSVTERLSISVVMHKAFVEVNEKGTEAAAASAVGMTSIGVGAQDMKEPLPVFRADHPFIYFVRQEPTGTILFMGRMTNPSDK